MAQTQSSDRPPCETEAFIWRECMKEFDYMPDKGVKRCDDPRIAYFACMNTWRQSDAAKADAAKLQAHSNTAFGMPRDCVGFSEKLRQCMEMNMFNTEHCKLEMHELQHCVAKYDPYVAAVVADDEQVAKRKRLVELARLEGIIALERAAAPRTWRNLWGLI
jgi:hypothetical protein